MSDAIKLSPSEVVLLHGDSFFTGGELREIGSEKKYFVTRDGEKGIARNGYTKVLGSDVLVPIRGFAKSVLAVVFLACEQSQLLRMDVRKDEWGTGQDTVVLTELRLNSNPYPPSAIESRIQGLLNQPPHVVKVHQLPELIHGLFSKKAPYFWGVSDPFLSILEIAKEGLAERNLLSVYEYAGTNFLTMLISKIKNPVDVWTTNARISNLRIVAASGVNSVKDLILDCQTQRPQFWTQFTKDISTGISSRKLPRSMTAP